MRPLYQYTDAQVAQVCHEANRALQDVQQDPIPSVPWIVEDPEIQASTIEGVRAVRQGIMPRESHEGWMAARYAQGWVWGPEKDPERKMHPNLVPYVDLPPGQKVKDWLFVAIITALTEGAN